MKAELARVYFEEFARFGFDFCTIIISTNCFFSEVKTMKWIGRRGFARKRKTKREGKTRVKLRRIDLDLFR